MEIRKVRDLTLVPISKGKVLVIACDSCGSVGMKEGDVLKVPVYFTGRFTSRVAIMEVLSAGAEVVTLTNSVCCEMNPTGEEVIRGIKDELKAAEIEEVVLTGSTEENFPTYSTGIGITVIGIADEYVLKVNKIKEPCAIISVGKPKVGSEIDLERDEDIINYNHLKELLAHPFVYEIVPGGSKGIRYEAELLAKNNGFVFKSNEEADIDMDKSCGPSTIAIAAVKLDKVEDIIKKISNSKVVGYVYMK